MGTPNIGWLQCTIRLVLLAESYLHNRTVSRNPLGLTDYKAKYQRPLRQKIHKTGIILAYYSDIKQSSQNDCQKPQTEQKLSVFQKMKQMTKDYWHILIPVHILTSLGWVAIFYTAVRKYVFMYCVHYVNSRCN